jgi:hypothetical protein
VVSTHSFFHPSWLPFWLVLFFSGNCLFWKQGLFFVFYSWSFFSALGLSAASFLKLWSFI